MNQKQTFRFKIAAVSVVILISCSSCGQKGDLYLPDGKQATVISLKIPV